MSGPHFFTLVFLLALLNSRLSFSADPPENSPSPAPQVRADAPAAPPSNSSSPSPSPTTPSPPTPPSSPSPSSSPSPHPNSPPAPPPPSDLAQKSSPSPAPAPAPGTNSTDTKKSPAPEPAVPSDIPNDDAGVMVPENDSSEGMSGGKKAGIAIGVIGSVCIVGFGTLVYRKRQSNIRRAQFGYDSRREFL